MNNTHATPGSRAHRSSLPALAGTAGLIFGLLFCLHFSRSLNAPEQADIELRTVDIALPPPPPPSPPQRRQQQPTAINLELNLAGAGPQIQTEQLDVEQTLADIEIDAPQPREDFNRWEQDLSVDWSAFSPDQLDNPPRVMHLARVDFPKDLSRRNIHRVVVRLDVFIDEAGEVNLIRIIENPYPVLEPAIRQLVAATRFTPPTHDGEPVRSRFVWPVEIKE